MFLVIVLSFIFLARSARIMYLTIVFYSIRGVCQALFMFQYPTDWIFDDPGLFSLMVPYQKASDFYYSGHSGFLMMSTLEFIQMRFVSVAFLNFLLMLFTGWMLITTRAHYTIGRTKVTLDVIIGWVFAIYTFRVVYLYKESWDRFFRKLFCIK